MSVSRYDPSIRVQEEKPKRSPLAGWFGRRANESEGAPLPAMDVSGGLTRAMRLAQTSLDMQARNTTREPIRNALGAIENALYVIDRVRDTIEEAFEVALSAQETDDPAARALLADNYDELRTSIASLAEEVSDEAAHTPGATIALIGDGRRQIDVQLGGQAHYSVSPTRLDASVDGLNLNPPREAFATDEEIQDILGELDRALHKADRAAASYCRDAQFLIARLELAVLP